MIFEVPSNVSRYVITTGFIWSCSCLLVTHTVEGLTLLPVVGGDVACISSRLEEALTLPCVLLQLAYCVVQFLEKDSSLTEPVSNLS